ncbi:MAG: hypothetical protein RIR00_1775 [Pseudomonadota bacterium]|jgi:hypothetical protein
MPRLRRLAQALATSALLALPGLATAESWQFAVIGDTPYSDYERQQLPLLLAALEQEPLQFVAHVGDIKKGSSRCDDAVFADIQQLFNRQRHPFVFIPGDNEWTDCRRVSNGSFEPLERLGKLRSLFWTDDYSLGQTRLRLERQPDYPEHSRFRIGPALFLTLNIPGPDNNYGLDGRGEFQQRNPALLRWISEGFAAARRDKLRGLVLLLQADPDFTRIGLQLSSPGFRELIALLRRETASFPGEVVFIHGDTHWMRIDQPLSDDNRKPLPNFTRVETYGSPFMGWIRGQIDSDNPKLFRFEANPWPAR